MRVLVTGGAGYVGSTLLPLLLSAGHEVRVIDSLVHGGDALLHAFAHPSFEFVHADITDSAAVSASVEAVEAVIHLAAIVGDPACARRPEMARAVNLDASLTLLEAAQSAGAARFVMASTCSNYGRMKDSNSLVDEESDLAPISVYAETKVEMEKALLVATGIAATPLRFATVYGVSPRMRFDLTVNEFTMEMLSRRRLVVFGEQFWRPYIHVQDAARAIAHVLSAPEQAVAGRVFNVGSSEENYQKAQLVDLIRPYAPDAVVEFVHHDEDPRDYRVSFARIHAELDYRTSRTVTQGIAEVARLVASGIIDDFQNPRYRN